MQLSPLFCDGVCRYCHRAFEYEHAAGFTINHYQTCRAARLVTGITDADSDLDVGEAVAAALALLAPAEDHAEPPGRPMPSPDRCPRCDRAECPRVASESAFAAFRLTDRPKVDCAAHAVDRDLSPDSRGPLAPPPSLAPLCARAEALLAVAARASSVAIGEMNEVAAALRDAPGIIREQGEVIARLTAAMEAAVEDLTHADRKPQQGAVARNTRNLLRTTLVALTKGVGLVELRDGDPCPECHVRGDHDPSCDRDEAWIRSEVPR